MLRQIQLTSDGSHTISIPEIGVTYHSHHGAIQESMHVFINAGLLHAAKLFPARPLHVLEIGFGTGLNALLTLREARSLKTAIHYSTVEKYPLTNEETSKLNYGEILQMQTDMDLIHHCKWETPVEVDPYFRLEKLKRELPSEINISPVHCIYLDAFAPDVQPELWSAPFFSQLFQLLHPQGILTTYSSKGTVRRALTEAGFTVEKIPGPYGKREIVRAQRLQL